MGGEKERVRKGEGGGEGEGMKGGGGGTKANEGKIEEGKLKHFTKLL